MENKVFSGSPTTEIDIHAGTVDGSFSNNVDRLQNLLVTQKSEVVGNESTDEEISASKVGEEGANAELLGKETSSNSEVIVNDDNNVGKMTDGLSKLNPFAKEFVPHSVNADQGSNSSSYGATSNHNYKKRPRRRGCSRTREVQQIENIRRTVFVSNIHKEVTEEQLATLFLNCGEVIDCRICAYPNSTLCFAFVEFGHEYSAKAALSLSGTILGCFPVYVQHSKTAIAPVNPLFLPRSEKERERCARTIYCTNIDKKVTQSDLVAFFERNCGSVSCMRWLPDQHYSTKAALVEFHMADSAMFAFHYCGTKLGSFQIRVNPSKTPVFSKAPVRTF